MGKMVKQSKSIQSTIKSFCEATTTHGLNHVQGGKNIYVRFLWLVLFLFSSSMLIYGIRDVARSYMLRRTLTSFEKKEVDSLALPALTVCSGSVLRRFAVPDEPILFSNRKMRGHVLRNENLISARAFHAMHSMSNFNSIADLKRASADGRQFFLTRLKSSCIVGIHDYCQYPTNITDFLTTSFSGLCFQMNSNSTFKQRDAGPPYGLSMILFANQSDYVPFSSFDVGGAILLKLHQPGEFPFPEMDGIAVAPGYLTRISLEKLVVHRLEHPYPSNCSDGTGINHLYPGIYTVSNCKRSCMVQHGIDHCKATDPLTMLLLNQTGKFGYKKLTTKMVQCLHDSARKSTSPTKDACICPPPCHEEYYQPTITQTRWPSKVDLPYYKEAFAYALNLSESDLTDDFIYENFLNINIFYDEMSYQEVNERKEWSVEKLIADLGGQMGIWLGASVLSGFEFLVLILSVIKRLALKLAPKLPCRHKAVHFSSNVTFVKPISITKEGP